MVRRYRCAWCGSYSSEYRGVLIAHIVNQHQDAVLTDLRRARYNDTREEVERLSTPLKTIQDVLDGDREEEN